ncbi:MAG: phosphatidylserine decarboxylase [Candidatus Spyradosoma sp.]
MKVEFFNRETGRTETEAIYGEGALRWVYETLLGKAALAVLIRRAFFSKIFGALMSRPSSRAKIAPFIAQYGLDPAEFADPVESFGSFNDFFSRKLKPSARPIADSAAVLPADGRHLAFPRADAGEMTIYAKGQAFDLEKLLGDAALARRYHGGAILCSRLCPTDYHRFHFPVAGTPSAPRVVNGELFSVNPIALSGRIAYLWENKREIVEIDSPEFGKVTQVIIGATNVGTIRTTFTPGKFHEKGAELGYFRFGGSFVATLFEPGRIALAEDLVRNSADGRETYAKMGTPLGAPAARE